MSKLMVAFFGAFVCTILSSFSQPQFTIHLTGGYNLPLPDLKGEVNDSSDYFNTCYMKSGYGFGADAKYYVGKTRNIAFTVSASYQLFSTSEESVTMYSEGISYVVRDFKKELNLLSIGLGIEYSFTPKGKAKPFIGVQFSRNFFSGNQESTLGMLKYESDLVSASRFGLAGAAGVDIVISSSIGVIIGAKYHIANLIGKDTTEITSSKYGLNDKEYTAPTGTTYPAKNISYIQGYLGVAFFLNQPKKVVKK